MQNRRGTEREDGAGGEEPEEQTAKQKKKQERLAYMMEQHAAYATATQLGVVTINLLLGAFILYRLNRYFSFLVSDQVRARFRCPLRVADAGGGGGGAIPCNDFSSVHNYDDRRHGAEEGGGEASGQMASRRW